MRSLCVVVTIVVLLGSRPGTTVAKSKELGPDNVVARFLEDCIVGPGREYRALSVHPITLDGPVRAGLDAADPVDAARRVADEIGLGISRVE